MTTLNPGEHTEKLEHSYIFGGNVKQYRHSGKQFHSFLKKK